MARVLSKEMECEYVSGMWRRDLEHQLLWRVQYPMAAVKEDQMRGPSWTWTSVDSTIEILDWRGNFYMKYVVQPLLEAAIRRLTLLITLILGNQMLSSGLQKLMTSA